MTPANLLPLIPTAVKAQIATDEALRAIETAMMGKRGQDLDGVISAIAGEFDDAASVDTMPVEYAQAVIRECFSKDK